MAKKDLRDRLTDFMRLWLSNPQAKADFVQLVEDIHYQPTHDHADEELLDWIDTNRSSLRSIGFK